jgi:hypothetical protein
MPLARVRRLCRRLVDAAPRMRRRGIKKHESP